ncbi:MAG: MMPL family transporter [Nitrospiraceae bacterium]|nr:MAG: MMPL family transporter [Nitrospiraceae bacterium]
MLLRISSLYEKIVLHRPILTLPAVVLIVAFFSIFVQDFKLDASGDSLVLENDEDLRYYRSIQARYRSDDYVIITYTPNNDLFSKESLSDLKRLRNSLSQIKRVESVASILDVPLINSPPITLAGVSDEARRLEDPDTDISLAKKELLTSPLYKNMIVSPDGNTTALQVIFRRDETFYSLLERRDGLREKELITKLTQEEEDELIEVSNEFKDYSADLMDRESRDIVRIRAIMNTYRDNAKLYLGGVPMITSDMIDFIRHDLSVFGFGVLCFLIVMLEIFFHKARWVVISMLCCLATVLIMFGLLGLFQWRVTVVSSNFTSLLLIITLSLTVHLIVRYHELYTENKGADQQYLISETMKSKVVPSIYTALTTIVAFGSLLVSGIRPVIDFGWMMSIGICVAFIISFVIFPSSLMLLKPKLALPHHDVIGSLTRRISNLVEKHGRSILVLYTVIAIMSVTGISRLTIENRFIDNFKKSTEIYQGMEMIDRELGGTTPLDIIVDAPADFISSEDEEDVIYEGEFDDEYDAEAGFSGTSYWYNEFRIDMLNAIHDYLDNLPETGKVLSIATTLNVMKQLNEDQPLDNITLSIIHKKLPAEIKKRLFDPYISEDGNQVRFTTRVFESDISLRRNALLKKIRLDLVNNIGLPVGQLHITGMVVLYNNMLQSLYRSQILTIGVVFLAIMMMFILLFRSLKLAAIAIIPNLISAGMVLGFMGWMAIPLDIMTITIAAITIGIAVDDTIHYMHRFLVEIPKDNNYIATMKRCHASIGRAMYYTSITVIVGFSILALSSFMPTIYFGFLTGLAMTVALIANLTLLPVLLITFKPGHGTSS